jgi:hypothetical protein
MKAIYLGANSLEEKNNIYTKEGLVIQTSLQ